MACNHCKKVNEKLAKLRPIIDEMIGRKKEDVTALSYLEDTARSIKEIENNKT